MYFMCVLGRVETSWVLLSWDGHDKLGRAEKLQLQEGVIYMQTWTAHWETNWTRTVNRSREQHWTALFKILHSSTKWRQLAVYNAMQNFAVAQFKKYTKNVYKMNFYDMQMFARNARTNHTLWSTVFLFSPLLVVICKFSLTFFGTVIFTSLFVWVWNRVCAHKSQKCSTKTINS